MHILNYCGQWGYAERVNGDVIDSEHHRAALHTAMGKVVMRPNPELIWIESQYGTKAYAIDRAVITVYDMASDEIYKGTTVDISEEDIVFVRDAAYLVGDVVVFKNYQ